MLETVLVILYQALQIYFILLILYILFSWVPEIRQSRFYEILHMICDPYMRIFRGWLVFGGMDFTPIIGFLFYRFGMQAFLMFIQSL